MPFVSIKIAKGRNIDEKRHLVQSVTQAIATAIQVQPEKIWIQIDEFETDNFAINGRLMSDRDQ